MTKTGTRAKKAAGTVLAISVALVAGWSSPASANPNGLFKWVSVRSGQCVDADLNTIGNNGGKVQLWSCNGQPQQNWISSSSNATIRSSKNNSKCLDADLNTINGNGTKVQLWDCNGSRQQQWSIAPGPGGSNRVISVYSGRCVDADLNTIGSDGAKVQLWDCNSQSQQDWRVAYF